MFGALRDHFYYVWRAGRPARLGAAFLAFCLLLLANAPLAQAKYASIVIDAGTGEVLHEVNADTRNYPASLTKMMTIYLTFEALEKGRLTLGHPLKASRQAARQPASRLGMRRGEKITVEDAILALVTKSANDVAVVLAETLGKSEKNFAKIMTRKAQALGMSRTTFGNASGLPHRGQLSTARDMATLSLALLRDFPQYYHYFSAKTFSYRGRTYRNHNKLLKNYRGADGLKTGYIRASGYNLAASSRRNGRRLIAVVFGGKTARSRNSHIAKLLDRGYTRIAQLPVPKTVFPAAPKPLALARAWLDAKRKGSQLATAAPRPIRKDLSQTEVAAAGDVAPVAARKPNKSSKGRFGVQVGAYYAYRRAEQRAAQAADALPDLLSGTRVSVTHVRGRKGRLFRARLVGLEQQQARLACKGLRAAEFDCLVVTVRGGTRVAGLN